MNHSSVSAVCLTALFKVLKTRHIIIQTHLSGVNELISIRVQTDESKDDSQQYKSKLVDRGTSESID